MDIDAACGIKASFQIVPEKRYAVSPAYLDAIRERGCEINVQGLDHDGNLFGNWETFLRHAQKINHYAKHFGAHGFRSPIMYRKVEWFKYLDFAYDMSVPNVAHLEPQRGGCCMVMPSVLPGGMLELPLTTIQDASLLHSLHEDALAGWRQQSRRILAGHGLLRCTIHSDAVRPPRAQAVYKGLLDELNRLRSDHGVWVALPGDVDRWWRERSAMALVADGAGWRIAGPGSARARVAYARVEGDRLVYEINAPRSVQDGQPWEHGTHGLCERRARSGSEA